MNISFLVGLCLATALIILVIFWNRLRIIRNAKQIAIQKQKQEKAEKVKNVKEETFRAEDVVTTKQESQVSKVEVKKSISRAEILLAHNEDDEAEKILVALLAEASENPDVYSLLASLYLKRKQYSRAEALYRTLIKIQKEKSAGSLSNLAFCVFEQNNFDEAIEFYEKALKLDPKNIKRYTNLGQVLFVTKQFEEAAKLFTKAIKIQHRNTEILFMLADTYREDGQFTKALQTYKKILDYEPYNAFAKEEIEKLEKKEAKQ